MAARGVIGVIGAEHADQLGDDVGLGELHDGGAGGVGGGVLDNREVTVAKRGDLGRCVMHSTCLVCPSSRSRSPTARAVWPPMPASTSSKTSVACPLREASAPAGVSAAAGGSETIGHCGKSEHHARELSAGADLAERARRNARIGGDHELDGVTARGAGVSRDEGDLEGGVGHCQRRELLAHGDLETRGETLARMAQVQDVIVKRGVRLAQAGSGLERAPLRRSPADRAARAHAAAYSSTAATVPPCLRVSRSIIARRSSTYIERAVLGRDLFAVAAQFGRQVLGLDHERAQALSERVQARIDTGERIQARGGDRHQLRASETLVLGSKRVRAGASGEAQRIETAQASTCGEQLVVFVLVERGGVDL